MSTILLVLLFFFLFATFTLTAVNNVFRRFRRHSPRSEVLKITRYFFYSSLERYLIKGENTETLFFATIWAKNIFRFLYGATAALLIFDLDFLLILYEDTGISTISIASWFLFTCAVFLFLFASLFIGDFLPRLCANRAPNRTIRFLSPVASIFLTLCLPVSYFLLKLSPLISKYTIAIKQSEVNNSLKEKIIEIIEESEATHTLDLNDKKLIESIITFKERIVREIMIPRIDVFKLSSEISAREATKLMIEKGFSRAPIYEENIDNIVGVFLVKDVLPSTIKENNNPSIHNFLDQRVGDFVKPVLYSPETQKVSTLLQEFKKKQAHLAVVVDEYGGTAGIVTIEDALEEIVGDIADEYDQESELYTIENDGSITVDARMNILEVEEKLGIQIPQEGDYDTIGGYIFYRAGEIPKEGLVIHHDQFELEILISNERSIEQVKIEPIIGKKRVHEKDHNP